MATDNFVGVILAGGKSSRFGANKALTELPDGLMIEHPAKILAALFQERLLVTNTPEEYAFLAWPMTGDIYQEAGPLAGIHAALKTAAKPLIFVAGCDMPFLDKEIILYLCDLASGYDVVIPRTTAGLEPLHAIYRQTVLATIEKSLDNGNRKIHRIFAELKVREVDEAELLAISGNLTSFRNINTIEDLRAHNV